MADSKGLQATFTKSKAALPKIPKAVLPDKDKALILKKIDVMLATLAVIIKSYDALIDESNKATDLIMKANDQKKLVDKKIDAFKQTMSKGEDEADGGKRMLSGAKDPVLAKLAKDFQDASDWFSAGSMSL